MYIYNSLITNKDDETAQKIKNNQNQINSVDHI